MKFWKKIQKGAPSLFHLSAVVRKTINGRVERKLPGSVIGAAMTSRVTRGKLIRAPMLGTAIDLVLLIGDLIIGVGKMDLHGAEGTPSITVQIGKDKDEGQGKETIIHASAVV